MPKPAHRPVMLAILDGWGWREEAADNAVRQAATPCFDALWAKGPRAFLRTSGRDVGLPDGQMGNSEVGHLNIGAGRVVMQDLVRIDAACLAPEAGGDPQGAIGTLPGFTTLVETLKASGGRLHLMGLLSPGGVLYFSTNYRGFQLHEEALLPCELREITAETVPEDYRNKRVHRCWRIIRTE